MSYDDVWTCDSCAEYRVENEAMLEVLNLLLTEIELRQGDVNLPADLVERVRAVVNRAEAA